jgi:hypothetical protein
MTQTNKGTQRGPQQIPKWNKGHFKKRDTWIKEDNTNYKRRVEQRYGKPWKKETNRNLEIKIPYSPTENTVATPADQNKWKTESQSSKIK